MRPYSAGIQASSPLILLTVYTMSDVFGMDSRFQFVHEFILPKPSNLVVNLQYLGKPWGSIYKLCVYAFPYANKGMFITGLSNQALHNDVGNKGIKQKMTAGKTFTLLFAFLHVKSFLLYSHGNAYE